MKKLTGVILLFVFVSVALFAHFQMIYTPTSIIDMKDSEVEFKIVFTHPFEAGHTMDIGKNKAGEVKGFKEFFSIHKGKKEDLLPSLKEIRFTSLENDGIGYELTLDKSNKFRGGGDWVLVGVPYPYYEPSEEGYIQQITKVMINKGELATDWDQRCAEGYPEIMPLVKPYDVWVGGIFRGVVLDSDGNPVPRAEIEVEYINYKVDMKNNKFTGRPKTKAGATIIYADDNGVFSFVPHKEGYWGFAALGAGKHDSYDGAELSEDAVLWIEAFKVK